MATRESHLGQNHISLRWITFAVIVAIATLWCLNFFEINKYQNLTNSDFSCTDGRDLAYLENTQLVRRVFHNALQPHEFSPRVLRWKSHVLIAHIENVSSTTAHVIHLLQNTTELRKPRVRDVLRTGRSVQWRTIRTLTVENATSIIGPVQLVDAPDGSGVVISVNFEQGAPDSRSTGVAVFVSFDDHLVHWRSAVHRNTKSRQLDMESWPMSTSSASASPGSLIRVTIAEASDNRQHMTIQRIFATDMLLSNTLYKCQGQADLVCNCGGLPGSNLTTVTMQLPNTMAPGSDAQVVSATVTLSTSVDVAKRQDDHVQVFVLSKNGVVSRINVDLGFATPQSCSDDVGYSTAAPIRPADVTTLTHPSNGIFSDFRLLRFNTKRFSVKSPNFSLFISASPHIAFDTLHTSAIASHKMQVVKLSDTDTFSSTGPHMFSPCSPILMHMGSLRGLHSTQLTDDTVLSVYVREFKGISSLHIAKIYVGDAHAAH